MFSLCSKYTEQIHYDYDILIARIFPRTVRVTASDKREKNSQISS